MSNDPRTPRTGHFSRCVAAEVRATMAARRLTIRDLAKSAGFASHNYLAIRLRDEKPFTLDDVERIAEVFDVEPTSMLQRAWDDHHERVFMETFEESAAERRQWTQEELRSPEVDAAIGRLDWATKTTRPARTKADMQELDDQAARDEESPA